MGVLWWANCSGDIMKIKWTKTTLHGPDSHAVERSVGTCIKIYFLTKLSEIVLLLRSPQGEVRTLQILLSRTEKNSLMNANLNWDGTEEEEKEEYRTYFKKKTARGTKNWYTIKYRHHWHIHHSSETFLDLVYIYVPTECSICAAY